MPFTPYIPNTATPSQAPKGFTPLGAKPAATDQPTPVTPVVNNKVFPTLGNSSLSSKMPNDTKVLNTASKIFPGAQLGKDLGTSAYAVEQGLKGGVQKILGNKAGSDQSFQNYKNAADSIEPSKDFGDAANIGLTVAAPTVGGETALGRVATNTALGAGIGTANAVAEGDQAKDVLKKGALGAVISGGVAGAGELATSITKNLPTWLTKMALPKLKDGNVEYALNNTSPSTLKTILEKSNQAVSDYGTKIENILSDEKYATQTGEVVKAIPSLIEQLPNAQLDNNGVISIVKKVVPGSKALVDKVADGSANLAEQNQLRQQLDMATKKIFTDNPSVTFNKQVAAKLSNILRSNVQGTAKETVPIFANFSKELDLNKAVTAAASKKRVLGGLLAGTAGFAKGGIKGAAEAIAIEEGIRSPAVQLAAAKGARQIGKSLPALGSIVKAIKAPTIKEITN